MQEMYSAEESYARAMARQQRPTFSLHEIFRIAKGYLFPKKNYLPGILSEIFDQKSSIYFSDRRSSPLVNFLTRKPIVALTNPEDIMKVLRQKDQARPEFVRNTFQMSRKPNVFTAKEKEDWKNLRVPMRDYFGRGGISYELADYIAENMDDLVHDGVINDVADMTSIISARLLGRSFLNYEITDEDALNVTDAYGNGMQKQMLYATAFRLFKKLPPDQFLPLKGTKKSHQVFKDLTKKIIKHNLKHMDQKSYVTDLIKTFSQDNSEEPRTLDEISKEAYEQVASQINIMLAGGIEAPRAQLYWALHLIARHPDIQEKLREEARQYPQGHVENYRETYAHSILKEATRLYSPVYSIMKEVLGDKPIALDENYELEPGTLAYFPVSAIQRDERWWGEDTEKFDPDRMHPDLDKDRPRAAFLSFGQGPHGCPGERDTYRQNISFLLTLMNKGFVLTADKEAMPKPTHSLLAKPPPNTELTIEKQNVFYQPEANPMANGQQPSWYT